MLSFYIIYVAYNAISKIISNSAGPDDSVYLFAFSLNPHVLSSHEWDARNLVTIIKMTRVSWQRIGIDPFFKDSVPNGQNAFRCHYQTYRLMIVSAFSMSSSSSSPVRKFSSFRSRTGPFQ